MTRARATSEITCGDARRGCGALLSYPTGSPLVRCALCDHVTRTPAATDPTRRRAVEFDFDFDDAGARDREAQARCVGCDVVMRFPADATHLKLVEGDLDQQMDLMVVIGRLSLSVVDASDPE